MLFTAAFIYSERPIRKERHLPAAAAFRFFIVFVFRCDSVQTVLVRSVQFSFKCRIIVLPPSSHTFIAMRVYSLSLRLSIFRAAV